MMMSSPPRPLLTSFVAFLVTLQACCITGFVTDSSKRKFSALTLSNRAWIQRVPTSSRSRPLHQGAAEAAQRLADLVWSIGNDGTADSTRIRELVLNLRNETVPGAPFDPTPLLGNFNVSYTLPPKDNENDRPVGGKWSRNPLLSIRRSYQHLVQPSAMAEEQGSVAQVVNVIVLRALVLWRIAVILRGDAYELPAEERVRIAQERQTPGGTLSERTVRANFDPPRILLDLAPDGFGEREARSEPAPQSTPPPAPPRRRAWLSLSLGPRSSVVLDTPYCDSRIRIGMGSRGSLFVFLRLPSRERSSSTAFEDPDTWREMLQIRPVGKLPLVTVFGSLAMASVFATVRTFSRSFLVWNRLWSLPLSLACVAATVVIATSTGGIENDSMSAREAQRIATKAGQSLVRPVSTANT